MATGAQYDFMYTRFFNLLENIGNQEYFQTHVLHYLPEKKFPACFSSWLLELKNKAPPATFLEKHRVLGDDEEYSLSKIRYTGSLMHTNAKAVNREVTGTMNPLWKFTFASGFNETSKFSYIYLDHINCF